MSSHNYRQRQLSTVTMMIALLVSALMLANNLQPVTAMETISNSAPQHAEYTSSSNSQEDAQATGNTLNEDHTKNIRQNTTTAPTVAPTGESTIAPTLAPNSTIAPTPAAPDNSTTVEPTVAPTPAATDNSTTTAPTQPPTDVPPEPVPQSNAPSKVPPVTSSPTSSPTVPYIPSTDAPSMAPSTNSTDHNKGHGGNKSKKSFLSKFIRFIFNLLLFFAILTGLYQLRLASNRQRLYAFCQQIWFQLRRVECKRRATEIVFKIGQILYKIPGVPRLTLAVMTRWTAWREGRNSGSGGGRGAGGGVSLNTVMGRDVDDNNLQESLLLNEETDV